MRDIFERIFNTNGWSSAESVSGTGSTMEQTTVIRERLPELFKKYAIKTLLDIPCGDFHWMNLVPKEGIKYIGADIVGGLVDRLSESHHHDFRVLDVTMSPLPVVDLILTRDCFVHLSYAAIFAAVQNIRASGSKYLLTTTFSDRENREIQTGDWRPINLQAEPFLFPAPLEVINEGCTECGGSFADKSLTLYQISDLPIL
tara:strand:- start:17230 stop:17832 length:603 start_codon:yes stop_codon:yes gene_type:complete